jgi:hypothetical protein
MGTGVDSDRGAGSAAKAREPCAALIFRRASALALVGMAAFTDIVITRRRAGWPVRRVSVRSRITRQSPAYAPFVAFADVSVAPPAIASADTACRIRFITVLTPIGETRFWYRNFKFPELLREQMPPCGIQICRNTPKATAWKCSKPSASLVLRASSQRKSMRRTSPGLQRRG